MPKTIKIGNREIGEGTPCFIIAELSANHQGSKERAIKTILAAKRAGADAIKLQTYTADTITLESDKEDFQIKGTIWDGRTLHDLYQEAHTPWEWQPELKRIAESEGLICFSSPFDFSAVDFLEAMEVPAYKIASFEITDIPLIEYVASKQKPVIISTGIAGLEDIVRALAACKRAGNGQVALLQCTSAYPAPLQEANLLTIPDLKQRFDVVAGLSDHTLGIIAPVTAVALGASIIEKHIILDKSAGGPDAAFSLDPEAFAEMVKSVRDAEKAMGKVNYSLSEKVKGSKIFARSLFFVKDVKVGETITTENIRSIRPGNGLHPEHYYEILGKKVAKEAEKGSPVTWEHLEGE